MAESLTAANIAWAGSWREKLEQGSPSEIILIAGGLLNEATRIRHAAYMSYISHLGIRMDTPEQEQLRIKVLAAYRADLGITDDDGWQDSELSDYAELRAERDRLADEVVRLQQQLKHE